MNTSLRISVVITTYDRAELCIRAIESVLAQTVSPHEVLVWDDGSSAETRALLRQFIAGQNKVVGLLEGERAGRPAVGRNRLVETATGDWIAFLDDDDEWLPKKLERQLPFLAGWDVVGAAAKRRSDGSTYVPRDGPIDRRGLLRDNPLVFSTVVVRRAMLRPFPETPGHAGLEDYCLWIELADNGARFVTIPEVVAIYDDDSTRDRLSVDRARLQRKLARHMFDRWRAGPLDRDAAAAAAIHALRAVKVLARSR